MGVEGTKGCGLHQFLTSKWVKDQALESGVAIMPVEEKDYLIMCAMNNCAEKDLHKLHDLKENYENSNR